LVRKEEPLQMRIGEAKQRDVGKKRARIGELYPVSVSQYALFPRSMRREQAQMPDIVAGIRFPGCESYA